MFSFSRWRWQSYWGLLAWLGALLRFWQIDRAPLWYDESVTYWMSTRPLADMIAATANDVHPPLWYLITWLTAHAGLDYWMIRLPAAALSVLALFMLKRIGEELRLSPGVIVGATALMALLPFELYYAQEARMYALLQAVSLWALLAVLARRWVQLSIAFTLMLYTHNYGVFYVAVFAGLALARAWSAGTAQSGGAASPPQTAVTDRSSPERAVPTWSSSLLALRDFHAILGDGRRRLSLFPPVAAALAAGLLYVPWAFVVVAQAAEQKSLWWKTASTPGQVLNVVYMLWFHLTMQSTLSVVAALVAFVFTFGALARTLVTRNRTAVQLAYLVIAPLLIALGVELVYRPILLYRAFIGSAGPLYLLVAWAFIDGLPRWKIAAAWSVLGSLLLISAMIYTPVNFLVKGGSRETDLWVAIEPHYRPGDLIYHADIGSLIDAYELRPKAPYQVLMPVQPGSLGVPNIRVRQALGIDERPLRDVAFERAWVVWTAGPTIHTNEDRAVAATLAEFPDRRLVYTVQTVTGEAQIWLVNR